MKAAYETHDRGGFLLAYYLFAYRLLSVPMIANGICRSSKRSFFTLQQTLTKTRWAPLVDSVAAALNLRPACESELWHLLGYAKAALDELRRAQGVPRALLLGLEDALWGTEEIIADGLFEDALLYLFISLSATERNAISLSASDRKNLDEGMVRLLCLMSLESWEQIGKTIEKAVSCAAQMEVYVQVFLSQTD